MIRFSDYIYSYPHQTHPVLNRLNLTLEEGEFLLVVGPSGAGKSTFLRTLNGLVPHFYGGRVSGSLQVMELNPVHAAPRGMAERVGFVFQNPESQFVMATVEEELVFAMENFALPQVTMRKRVEEVLDQLNIAHLRGRRIDTLSGGEKQRVAIAAVLTLQPRVLVLDEPTSQLDPQAAEEVLIVLRQLNEDLGLTVICAEQRLERVVQYADRLLYFSEAGHPPLLGSPTEVLAQIPLTPPLISLAKSLAWQPLPLTIKDGRRFARRLKPFADDRGPVPNVAATPTTRSDSPPVAQITHVWHAYGDHETLRDITLEILPGEILAVMGRNGSGKTTLLKLLSGLLKPARGTITVGGQEVGRSSAAQILRHVGYVPQQSAGLLFNESVREELEFTRRSRGMAADAEADRNLLHALDIDHLAHSNPRDLSVGEQQRVALAALLVAGPRILLLDEPTRGLDYPNKQRLRRFLQDARSRGTAVVLVTHDVELVAATADRVALLAEGQIVLEGPMRDVLQDSLVFSPQIHKLFQDRALMTVEDVLATLPARHASAASGRPS